MRDTFIPKPYQARAVEWALEKPKCGLFLPMGSGKTATTLEVIRRLKEEGKLQRVLIIGPKQVCLSTWPDEIEKWSNFAGLTYSVAIGSVKAREAALQADADIYLINREMVPWLVERGIWRWKMVVVDELSSFKSSQAQRWRLLKKIKYERFIGLTGTPAPRSLIDIWPQLYLIDKGERLGKSKNAFLKKYCYPELSDGHIVYKYGLLPGAESEIHAKISDICMSISEEEYDTRPDLQMVTVPVWINLTGYNRLKKEYVLTENITAANAGVLCGKLLQLTSGAIYDNDHEVVPLHCCKLDALKELIEAAQGQPIIVFYYFQHELERLRVLNGAHTMDGPETVKKWNAGEIPILLLHPASAGHGLNLQKGGHLAVWYSLPNWNLELYQQANARIYRQGQKEKCIIYHLVAKDTIDELMMQALEKKKVTQANLLEALQHEARSSN